jgi:hypothetical protein
MAQKDNALNNQLANASLRVSEASYRDSTAMKSLAEDSKHVLLATSRDSSMMCIIAILTLAFLPPTFTAVSERSLYEQASLAENCRHCSAPSSLTLPRPMEVISYRLGSGSTGW